MPLESIQFRDSACENRCECGMLYTMLWVLVEKRYMRIITVTQSKLGLKEKKSPLATVLTTLTFSYLI